MLVYTCWCQADITRLLQASPWILAQDVHAELLAYIHDCKCDPPTSRRLAGTQCHDRRRCEKSSSTLISLCVQQCLTSLLPLNCGPNAACACMSWLRGVLQSGCRAMSVSSSTQLAWKRLSRLRHRCWLTAFRLSVLHCMLTAGFCLLWRCRSLLCCWRWLDIASHQAEDAEPVAGPAVRGVNMEFRNPGQRYAQCAQSHAEINCAQGTAMRVRLFGKLANSHQGAVTSRRDSRDEEGMHH